MPEASRWKLSLVALLVLVAACGKDSPFVPEPTVPFAVEISSAVVSATRPNGSFDCTFEFTANATGGATGAHATWTPNAAVVIRALSGEAAIGGSTLPPTYFEDPSPRGWGGARIQSGEQRSLRVRHPSPQAYRVEFLAEYRVSGVDTTAVARTTARCE